MIFRLAKLSRGHRARGDQMNVIVFLALWLQILLAFIITRALIKIYGRLGEILEELRKK
jgi:biopolymer transport protein ExbD